MKKDPIDYLVRSPPSAGASASLVFAQDPFPTDDDVNKHCEAVILSRLRKHAIGCLPHRGLSSVARPDPHHAGGRQERSGDQTIFCGPIWRHACWQNRRIALADLSCAGRRHPAGCPDAFQRLSVVEKAIHSGSRIGCGGGAAVDPMLPA